METTSRAYIMTIFGFGYIAKADDIQVDEYGVLRITQGSSIVENPDNPNNFRLRQVNSHVLLPHQIEEMKVYA